MIRPLNRAWSLALCVALAHANPAARAQVFEPRGVNIRVKAGDHRRAGTPIRFEVPANRYDPSLLKALEAGPVQLDPLRFPAEVPPTALPDYASTATTCQVEKAEGRADLLRVTCVLGDEIPAGGSVRYRLTYPHFGERPADPRRWSFDRSRPGSLGLKAGDRDVFRYNGSPVSSPNYGPIQARDAYIHPAYSPSGALITGDFSSSHPHHRGFFLAYERTQWGDLKPDFWNIHLGTGKIYADGIDPPVVGPVTARFSARHRWEAKDKATGQGTVVLRERWDVEAYAVPGQSYWLFDVTSTQQAVGKPLVLQPYRYGGMAYRGPEPFVKGTLDVLTSEGKNRVDGDQKPARWVDLTGPVAEGSVRYAGAMIADHPSNPHYPTVARIHPTTLPFFCFVPAHDRPLTIAADAPTVFRYRVLIHDGHPNAKLDEAVARDFAEPPTVVVE